MTITARRARVLVVGGGAAAARNVGAMDGLVALRERLLARGDAVRRSDAAESLLDDDVCQSIERGSFARRLAAWQ